MLSSTVRICNAGDHLSLSMSKQILPNLQDTDQRVVRAQGAQGRAFGAAAYLSMFGW